MEKLNVFQFSVTHEKRIGKLNQTPKLIWFTGLSGSGKSTLANALEERLFEKGLLTYILDGDHVRMGINKDLGFSKEDRKENLRRVAEIARLFLDAGFIVIAAFVSPLESDRALVKSIVGADRYFEVYVNTPLEICEKRDVKGLYLKAKSGEISNFTGISALYEPPSNPFLSVDTSDKELQLNIDYIFNKTYLL